MSLLLQALQKASKSRDGEDAENAADAASDAADLSLEPVSEPQFSDEPAPSDSATPAQAAAVLRANQDTSYSIIDRIRDRPIIGFIIGAVLFAIGYGMYVYIQIASPGSLRRTPPPAPPMLAAAPQATAGTVVGSAPAKVTGMPGIEPVSGAPAESPLVPDSPKHSNIEAGSTGPGLVAASKPKRKRSERSSRPRAAPERIAAAEADGADHLEVIEIPASEPLAAIAPDSGGERISVRRAPSSVLPVDPTLAAAYAALQKGDYETANKLYLQVLAADSRNIDAMLGLAAIERKRSRIDQAGRHYRRVLELDPRNAHAQAGLIAMLGSADPAASESRLKQIIGREPSSFVYFTLGNLYAEQGQWPSAQQAYFQAFQLQTDNPDFAFNLAVGLEHVGQPRLALEYYRKALDLSFRKGHANFDQSLAIQRVGQLSARAE